MSQQQQASNGSGIGAAALQSIGGGFVASGGIIGNLIAGTIAVLIFCCIMYALYTLLVDITTGLFALRVKMELVALTIAKVCLYAAIGITAAITATMLLVHYPFLSATLKEAQKSKAWSFAMVAVGGTLMYPLIMLLMAAAFTSVLGSVDYSYTHVTQNADGTLHLQRTDVAIEGDQQNAAAWKGANDGK